LVSTQAKTRGYLPENQLNAPSITAPDGALAVV
jgi:hypothetical protein